MYGLGISKFVVLNHFYCIHFYCIVLSHFYFIEFYFIVLAVPILDQIGNSFSLKWLHGFFCSLYQIEGIGV